VGHSEIFSKVTDEIPFTLASSDKIEPTNVFDRRFSVEFQISRVDTFNAHFKILKE
jgi:hypothetical protein